MKILFLFCSKGKYKHKGTMYVFKPDNVKSQATDHKGKNFKKSYTGWSALIEDMCFSFSFSFFATKV